MQWLFHSIPLHALILNLQSRFERFIITRNGFMHSASRYYYILFGFVCHRRIPCQFSGHGRGHIEFVLMQTHIPSKILSKYSARKILSSGCILSNGFSFSSFVSIAAIYPKQSANISAIFIGGQSKLFVNIFSWI